MKGQVQIPAGIKFLTMLISIAFVAIILFAMFNPFVIVEAGTRGVQLNWGAVSDTILTEGIHFQIPIMQKIIPMDVRVKKIQLKSSAASKDLQTVHAEVALNYSIIPESVNKVYQKLGVDYEENIIQPTIQESVKASTAKYTAEELIIKREEVKEDIKRRLVEKLQHEYMTVSDFSIINFEFSAEFNKAIEAKQTAVQEALKAENDLRTVKMEAEQQIAKAKAEAETIKIQAEAITQQGGKDYVQLKAIEKWDGRLPTQMVPNSTVPFLNLKNE